MRLHHRLTPVVGVLLVLISAPMAFGQTFDGSYGGGYPPVGAVPPGPGYTTDSRNVVTPFGPPGAEQSMQPWPTMSPFDYSFSQHHMDRGLWMHENNRLTKRYYFSAEAIFARFAEPGNKLFGAPGIPPIDPALFPNTTFPTVDPLTGLTPFGLPPEELFEPVRLTDAFPHDFKTEGMRFVWGMKRADSSSIEVEGWWASDVDDFFKLGVPGDQNDPSTLRNTAGLPLFDPLGGTTVRYDKLFQLTYNTEAFGAAISFLRTPIYSGDAFKLYQLWGARYTHIDEKLAFYGADSGLLYAVDFADPNTFNNPLNITGEVTQPDPTQPIVASGFGPYDSFLDAQVRSHLAGPEIGFRFELGGENVMVLGTTKFGVMANREEMDLTGDDIGDGLAQSLDNGPDGNFFYRNEKHTHISPTFEQKVEGTFRIMRHIPYIKRIEAFKDARLKIGYSYFVAGEIARPGDSIEFRGLPLTPKIDIDRSTWHMSQWNFGIDWPY